MKLNRDSFFIISELDQCDAFLREHGDVVDQIFSDASDREDTDEEDEEYLDVVKNLASYFMLDSIRKEGEEYEREDNCG